MQHHKTIFNFVRNTRAVAAVEFALAVPIMLLVYLGSVEASALISVDRKVLLVASSVGDIVSRTDGTLSNSTLNDYFKAATGIMHPYNALPAVQTISGMTIDGGGKVTVVWSKQYKDGKRNDSGALPLGSSYALPAEFIAIARNRTAIVSQTSYSYRPFYGIVFDQAINLQHVSFHLPRTAKGVTIGQ